MNDMILPEGKTCADCYHCNRCTKIFGVNSENIECDFSPSRFVELDKIEGDKHG